MNIYKKIIAFSTAVLLCMTSLSACGEVEAPKSAEGKNNLSESLSEETEITSEDPKADDISQTDDTIPWDIEIETDTDSIDISEHEQKEPIDELPELREVMLDYLDAVTNKDFDRYYSYVHSYTGRDDIRDYAEETGSDEIYETAMEKEYRDVLFVSDLDSFDGVEFCCTQTIRFDPQQTAVSPLDDTLTEEGLAEMQALDAQGNVLGEFIAILAKYEGEGWSVIRKERKTNFSEAYYLTDPVLFKLNKLSDIAFTLALGANWTYMMFPDSGTPSLGKINGIFSSDPAYDTLTSDIYTEEELNDIRSNIKSFLAKEYGYDLDKMSWIFEFKDGSASAVYLAENDESEYVGFGSEYTLYKDFYDGATELTQGGIWTKI